MTKPISEIELPNPKCILYNFFDLRMFTSPQGFISGFKFYIIFILSPTAFPPCFFSLFLSPDY